MFHYYQYIQGTGRFVPEVAIFLNDLLSLFLLSNLPSSSALKGAVSSFVREISTETFLRVGGSSKGKNIGRNDSIPLFSFPAVLTKKPTDLCFAQDTYRFVQPSSALRGVVIMHPS